MLGVCVVLGGQRNYSNHVVVGRFFEDFSLKIIYILHKPKPES